MNFRILNYFLTVANEQSITKAAELLHITQPTLSRQLVQLEEELGTKLFERTQHKLSLTPAGDMLVHRGREILQLVEKTESDLKDQETNLSGNICFGAGEISAVAKLAEIIRAFQKKYPAVTFDLFTGPSDIVMERMEKGLTDISLLLGPIDTTNYNYLLIPEKEETGILMRKNAELAAKKFVTAHDLAGKSVLLPSRLSVRSETLNWLSGDLANINFVGTSNLLENAQILVHCNDYYAITVKPYLIDSDKICFRPIVPPLENKVYLAWRAGSRVNITTQKFIEFAKCFLSIE